VALRATRAARAYHYFNYPVETVTSKLHVRVGKGRFMRRGTSRGWQAPESPARERILKSVTNLVTLGVSEGVLYDGM